MATIIYFSGSGNGFFLANEVAKATGANLVSLKNAPSVIEDEEVGFVFPNYCGDIPTFVFDKLKEMNFTGTKYCYFLLDAGLNEGFAKNTMQDLLKEKGVALNYYDLLCFSSNFFTTIVNVSQKIREKLNKRATDKLPLVIENIKNRISLPIKKKNGFLDFNKKIAYFFIVKFLRGERKIATSDCIGCGLCESLCPTHNIKISDGKAVFGNDCTYCYSCCHWCPTGAVKFGRITIKGLKQYRNPNVDSKDLI